MPTTLRNPGQIGRYRVECLLGTGGMGEVYLCHDDVLGRRVAVKRARRRQSSSAHERLRREAWALAQIDHPNVVRVFDSGEVNGRSYLAMEYVQGPNLRVWLESRRAWTEILARFIEAGRGLAAAHAAGLVHRDFKPDNVLIGRDGVARVVDFGLVCCACGIEPSTGAHAVARPQAALSPPGALIGTRQYMPEEQLLGHTVDARADQFAFCVSLYEALWGELPAVDASLARLREPPCLRGLFGIIRRGLAPDPAERWSSMDALLAALTRARRRRLYGSRSAMASPLLGLAFALCASMLSPTRQCRVVSAQLDATWNNEIREGLEARLDQLEPPHSRTSGTLVVEGLERWSTTWVESRRGACEVLLDPSAPMNTRHEASERQVCLDHQQRVVTQIVEALMAPPSPTPSEMGVFVAAVAHLATDRACPVDDETKAKLVERGECEHVADPTHPGECPGLRRHHDRVDNRAGRSARGG